MLHQLGSVDNLVFQPPQCGQSFFFHHVRCHVWDVLFSIILFTVLSNHLLSVSARLYCWSEPLVGLPAWFLFTYFAPAHKEHEAKQYFTTQAASCCLRKREEPRGEKSIHNFIISESDSRNEAFRVMFFSV